MKDTSSRLAFLVSDRVTPPALAETLILAGNEVECVHAAATALAEVERRRPALVVAGPLRVPVALDHLLTRLHELGIEEVVVVSDDPVTVSLAPALNYKVRYPTADAAWTTASAYDSLTSAPLRG